MKIFKLAILLLTLSFSCAAYGATELGEVCFSGDFLKDGNCNARLEITQHIRNYSINGVVVCDIQTNSDGVSGIASGSGYIDGNIFKGSLVIPHEYGRIGVSLSEVSTNSMNFEVNLSNLNTIFSKTTVSSDLCGGGFIATCIEEAVFTLTECP